MRKQLPPDALLSRDCDAVADRYDLLNTLNPGYRKHLGWSARRLGMRDEARVLDLCCGTGLSTQAPREAYPRAQITTLDASPGMLRVASKKATDGWQRGVTHTFLAEVAV